MAVVVILGKKGTGKSSLLRRLVYQRLQGAPRHTVFFDDSGCQVRGGVVFTSAAQAAKHIAARGVPRLAVFRGVDVDDIAQLALRVHDVTLVLDELDRACNGKAFSSEAVKRIVHYGRHERVDLWGTFRSTRNVSEDLLNAADRIFLLHHSAACYPDIDAIRRRFGPQIADAVTRLEPWRFVAWSDE